MFVDWCSPDDVDVVVRVGAIPMLYSLRCCVDWCYPDDVANPVHSCPVHSRTWRCVVDV